MNSAAQRRNWSIAAMGLGILGLTTGSVMAQSSRDIVINTEPGAGNDVVVEGNDRIVDAQRFVCQNDQGRYTVMYQPESRPGELYPWAVPQEMGGGWSEERRCAEIARRLEMYREDGLVELTTGRENGYDTVCVTTELNSSCQIVLTVPRGQSAIVTRDRIFDNLLTADSGIQTQGVNTLTSNGSNDNILGQLQSILGGLSTSGQQHSSRGINLKPFLDPADGGTGELLSPGQASQPTTIPSRNGLRLNTELFR